MRLFQQFTFRFPFLAKSKANTRTTKKLTHLTRFVYRYNTYKKKTTTNYSFLDDLKSKN